MATKTKTRAKGLAKRLADWGTRDSGLTYSPETGGALARMIPLWERETKRMTNGALLTIPGQARTFTFMIHDDGRICGYTYKRCDACEERTDIGTTDDPKPRSRRRFKPLAATSASPSPTAIPSDDPEPIPAI